MSAKQAMFGELTVAQLEKHLWSAVAMNRYLAELGYDG